MEYRWIEDIREFEDIANKWDETLIASGDYNPFLLSDFIVTWWKYYHDNSRLRIFIIYDNDKISSGIPLFLKRSSFREGFARILHYVGGTVANYTEPLYAGSEIKILPMLAEALVKKKDWDALHLTDVRAESKLMMEYNDGLFDKKLPLFLIQDHMNWAIDLSAGKDEYMATVSKKLRRDLKSKRRFVVKNYGRLELKEIKGKEEIERYFDIYTNFSRRSFSSRNRKSAFENFGYTAFFREFLTVMDQKQRLYAHALLAGEKILAISFGYRFGKGFNWILTAFNYEYRLVRPGYLLIEELINEISNRGETYYNWYGHARFYKTQWCNRQFPLFHFFLINPTRAGLCYKTLKRIENILRANMMFMNIIRKLKIEK